MISEIILLFSDFLARDPATRSHVEQSTADVFIQGDNLVFSLPGLWDLLFSERGEVTYSSFRAEIYRSTLNADLAEMRAVVKVYRSSGKVDDSLYQLCLLDSDE